MQPCQRSVPLGEGCVGCEILACELASVRVQPARHETTERADRFLLILAFTTESVDECLVVVQAEKARVVVGSDSKDKVLIPKRDGAGHLASATVAGGSSAVPSKSAGVLTSRYSFPNTSR